MHIQHLIFLMSHAKQYQVYGNSLDQDAIPLRTAIDNLIH